MKLKIDTEPKIYSLEFSTRGQFYNQSMSPRSIQQKSGAEFDHFRPYQDGDDARYIDWIASGRAQQPLVRVYSENISLNVLIMLDVSESMFFGTGDKGKIEYAIELALNMAFGVLNYGDQVAVIASNDKVVHYTPFISGIEQFETVRQILLDTKDYGGNFDLKDAINLIVEQYKETHILIMISDFIGGDIYNDIHSVADRFDILGILVYDRSEIELTGVPFLNLKDPYTNQTTHVNVQSIKKRYKQEMMKKLEGLRIFFTTIEKDIWTIGVGERIEQVIPDLLAKRNNEE
ncbi:MAG: DUF58 domain-containing protein [Candidatus Woesearchaeota archaeon]